MVASTSSRNSLSKPASRLSFLSQRSHDADEAVQSQTNWATRGAKKASSLLNSPALRSTRPIVQPQSADVSSPGPLTLFPGPDLLRGLETRSVSEATLSPLVGEQLHPVHRTDVDTSRATRTRNCRLAGLDRTLSPADATAFETGRRTSFSSSSSSCSCSVATATGSLNAWTAGSPVFHQHQQPHLLLTTSLLSQTSTLTDTTQASSLAGTADSAPGRSDMVQLDGDGEEEWRKQTGWSEQREGRPRDEDEAETEAEALDHSLNAWPAQEGSRSGLAGQDGAELAVVNGGTPRTGKQHQSATSAATFVRGLGSPLFRFSDRVGLNREKKAKRTDPDKTAKASRKVDASQAECDRFQQFFP
ncbi:unnamed protein product [Protopolystoma xenopodis]|uniref:Uncharacterized protein n=1 Tax=Protopolystoma xenopodis TaxID=117903 RepID=A0A3S5A121_9PLAT|nr:unnamed protein product [Protopolystoma xenopodis]